MKRFGYFLAICLTLLTSCDKIDFSKLETGKPYTGFCQGLDCVVMIDHAESGNVKGRIYLDKGNIMAQPIPFLSDLKKNGKGKLWINNQEKKIFNVTIDDGRLQGDVDKASFLFNLYQSSDLPFNAQYMEPCNGVKVNRDTLIYAKEVKGYWASYPDTGESFGTIYMRRAPNLVSKKTMDLDLDLYYPEGQPKEERRPLLLLIHGGAFYNGDKRDVGFPEMGRHFAERGYVVASINYRLGFMLLGADVDRAGYRALQDAYAATCYLIDKADEYGIDTTKIFAAGASAGAITALNLAFMRDENRPETTKIGGAVGWISSTISSSLNILTKGVGLLGFNFGLDGSEICKDLGLDSDLGPINLVSDKFSRPFQVKAIINMWGAVHSLEILNNSRQTDILSFHGDSDRIVPYAYGYPFDNVLEPYADSLLLSLPKLIQIIGGKLFDRGKPFNEWAFNPLFGSSLIHNKALSKGLRSELITVKGGKHSMHQNDYRTLSAYFNDTILPKMTRFLCEKIVGGKTVRLEHAGLWVEALDTDNVAELHWQVEGGAVLNSQGDNRVKVLLFGDAPRHYIIAGGKYKNGIEFRESLSDKTLFRIH